MNDSKDVAPDVQGFAYGQRSNLKIPSGQHTQTNTASQFKTATKFADQVEADYPQAQVDFTGHSPGWKVRDR
ncbi:MAG: hypothetical protein LKJ69_06820 [Lactobacillus sp.]|nr:hypothetical protein [Lactobacillus sp.]